VLVLPAELGGDLSVRSSGAESGWVNSEELEVDFLWAGLLLY